MRSTDIVGRQYGSLTVKSRAGSSQWKKALWLCTCHCGCSVTLTSGDLNSGNTKSCGCLKRAKAIATREEVEFPEPVPGCVFVPLNLGLSALIDEQDFDKVTRHVWTAAWSKSSKSYYAVANAPESEGGGTILMHRLVLDCPKGMLADHIKSSETLDNRRSNLRVATKNDSARNCALRCDNKSGYKGVYWKKSNSRWIAQITVERKKIHIGCFVEKDAAIAAYQEAALFYFGEFASF